MKAPDKTDHSSPAQERPPLEINGLNVAYDRKLVLKDIDFTVPAGHLVAIIGPNGAGKSTLIKATLGLTQKLSGQVRIYGKDTRRVRNRIAYMPQRTSVDWDFPTSAVDVVAMGLYGKIGWLKPVLKKHKKEAGHYLSQVGLSEYADRQIGQLSGGQQQRVFLARALAQQADMYLMDEPFAGVDAATESAILNVLKTLKEEGKTVICVHHDLQTVEQYFDYVLAINLRKIAEGPAADVMTTETLQQTYGGQLIIAAPK